MLQLSKYFKSESVEILRSKITPSNYNPRKISNEALDKLKQNVKKIGLLGGLVYNQRTGNIVSGHQRLTVLDQLNKYDGTEKTDYLLRVEKIDIDLKQEKEQNIFMNSPTVMGEFDKELLAIMLPDIDTKLAGLDTEDINLIIAEVPNIDFGDNTEISDSFAELEQKSQEQKEQSKKAIKDLKKDIKDRITTENEGQSYFVVTFDNFDNKAQFMERYGFNQNDKYIKGEIFANVIDNILQ